MLDIAGPSKPLTAGHQTIVVLLLPEAMEGFKDTARLRTTLAGSAKAVRVLLCLPSMPPGLPPDPAGHAFAAVLAEVGVETEILLGPGVEAPSTKAYVLRAPPDISAKDQNEFALALSDVVLIASPSQQSVFMQTVRDLGKPMVVPGAPLPGIPTFTSVTRNLDPDLPGWRARRRSVFGRLEQLLIEALAYNWLGREKNGGAESRKRLRKCIGKWRPGPYFAPDAWITLIPDRSAVDESSRMVARFNALDRSALHGSFIHRDLAWIAHFGAAFAVLFAVAGHLFHDWGWGRGWSWALGILELVTLLMVASLVFGARRTSLQERWTACRLGAEQLRIARMSLPLLVLPPALATADTRPAVRGHSSKETELGFDALAEVKRVVRDHGLPRLAPGVAPVPAAEWLHLIVGDQVKYHHDNHHKLDHAEKRLLFITQCIFAAAIVAVILHFITHAESLLLVTAAAPAFAAALHGTGTRLGIVHRAALSIDAERELKQIKDSLASLINGPPAVDEAWRQVRHLASEAAKAMGRESTSWHGLVRRYRDELP
jgi:hypothetical protein